MGGRASIYRVTAPSGREITVVAANSTQAKRKACRYWGVSPSNEWVGMSVLQAEKIKKEDVYKSSAGKPRNSFRG